jgi:hypothetical protein
MSHGGPGGQNATGFNGAPAPHQSLSSQYPAADNGHVGDDIDELIRMAEAGIKPPKKTDPVPLSASVTGPKPGLASLPMQAQVPKVSGVKSRVEEEQEPTAVVKPESDKKKKEKAPTGRLVYSDNDVSPEEKMAMLSRYAFIPEISSSETLDRPLAAAEHLVPA